MSTLALIVGYVTMSLVAVSILAFLALKIWDFLTDHVSVRRLYPQYRWTTFAWRTHDPTKPRARMLLLSIPGVLYGVHVFLHRQRTLRLIAHQQMMQSLFGGDGDPTIHAWNSSEPT